MNEAISHTVSEAIAAFKRGEPVLIHDAADREGETDLVYPATAITPKAIARLRNDAGGLICVALTDAVSHTFGLPFIQEAIDHPTTSDHDLAYDDRSSFSLTVNHRATRTGITDIDRARTITALGEAAAAPDQVDFASTFRSPGHVHILRAASGLLDERQGHTELGIALANAAGIAPAVVVCEMLDDETGAALPPPNARAYAERTDAVYLEGKTLLETL